MAEYYGYAERDANSYVDWGKLGQNLTETVETAYKLREEKKQKLDEIMQKNYAELANSPTGQNQDINSAIVQHADNSKQYLLQINKLLKAGILQPKDYTLINQNLGEDTKALFNNAKNWQTAYGKILERNKNNEGSKAELDISADVSAFGKFKDMQFMINPTTGRLSAAQMITGPNGEQIKGDSKSMQQINVLMNQPIDKYKLTDKLVNAEKTIGEFVNDTLVRGQIQKQGSITRVEDKAIKETFTNAKNTFVSEIMANPFNVMSILADYVGTVPGTSTPYNVSTNPADRGKEGVIMYVDPDGDGSYQPELTEQQRKAAEEYVTNQFVGMIDRKVTRQTVSQVQRDEQSAAAYGREEERKTSGLVGTAVGNMVSGNPKQAEDGREFFENFTKPDGSRAFESVVIDPNGILTMVDANTKQQYTFNLKGENKRGVVQKLHSTLGNITGAYDTDYYVRTAMQAGGPGVTAIAGGVFASKPVEAPKEFAAADFSNEIIKNEPKITAKNLMAILPKDRGYSINTDLGILSGVGIPSDIIQIVQKLPDGTIITSKEFVIDEEKEAQAAAAGIAAFVNRREKEAQQQSTQQAGQKGELD